MAKKEDNALIDLSAAIAASGMSEETQLDSSVAESALQAYRLPEIRIAQNEKTSGWYAGMPFGAVFHTQTGEIWDKENPVEFILCLTKMNRIKFPKTYSQDNQALCASDDGLVPTGLGDAPMPGPCAVKGPKGYQTVCPDAKIEKDREGNWIRSRCGESIVAIIYLPGDRSGCILRIKSTMHKPWKGFFQRLTGKARSLEPIPGLSPRFRVVGKMWAEPEGIYYVPRFEVSRETTQAEILDLLSHGEELRSMLEQSRGMDEVRVAPAGADDEITDPDETF